MVKKILTNEAIIKPLSKNKLSTEIFKFFNYNKPHNGPCLNKKITAAFTSCDKETQEYQCCNKSAHTYMVKYMKRFVSHQVIYCPEFKRASDQQKRSMISKVKKTHLISLNFSLWCH